MSTTTKVLTFPREGRPLVKRTLAAGGYEADFYYDTSTAIPIYHYIITKKDCGDILAWGQEYTAADAERAALDFMHDLYQRSQGQAATG